MTDYTLVDTNLSSEWTDPPPHWCEHLIPFDHVKQPLLSRCASVWQTL